MNEEQITKSKEEINESFSSLFSSVDNLISDMKLQSSEEILNGSVVEAQKLLEQILPYQSFYEKLKETKDVFDKINSVPKEEIEQVKEKIEALDQKGNSEEVNKKQTQEGKKQKNEVQQPEDEVTSQINYRIPVLKALIYLGGSSEETEVTDFVKKEMKSKLTDKDKEISENGDKEVWLTNLYFETATMIDEGLLVKSSDKRWEIVQKGIDYLSKYAK